jgi:uncharacterized protein YutD
MPQMLTDVLNLRGYQVADKTWLQLELSGFISQPKVCDLVITDQKMSRISGGILLICKAVSRLTAF